MDGGNAPSSFIHSSLSTGAACDVPTEMKHKAYANAHPHPKSPQMQ